MEQTTALSGSRYLKPPALPEVADLLLETNTPLRSIQWWSAGAMGMSRTSDKNVLINYGPYSFSGR
jgi:hypothetical protein